MAVLKRFSYDNIVEHNPTAPDPVEGGGGSGGGGGIFLITVTSTSEEDATADKTFDEILAAYNEGNVPVVYVLMPTELGGTMHIGTAYLTGYNSDDSEFEFDSSLVLGAHDSTHLAAYMFSVTIGSRLLRMRSRDYLISGTLNN